MREIGIDKEAASKFDAVMDFIVWLQERGANYISIDGVCSATFDPKTTIPHTEREPQKPAEPVDERTGFTESELFASSE